jgi:cytochrome P450
LVGTAKAAEVSGLADVSAVANVDWWALLTDRSYLADPYPWLKQLQQRGPVHHDQASDVWFVLGHREFGQLAKAPQLGRDTRLWRGGWCTPENRQRDPVSYELLSEFQPQMINANPPDHRRMRDVFESAFKPSAIAALAPMIRAEADRLLHDMPNGSTLDFIEKFAAPLPLRVLCNLFEIPVQMDADIGRWSAALIKIGDIMMTADQKRDAHAALTQFKAYLREHLESRPKHAGDGMMDLVTRAFADGTLDEQEMLTNLVAMLIAGHETTVTLIGNGMLALLRHPDQMARLRSDRGLVRSAVEEFLRYEPGGNMILRVAIEDYRVGESVIPAGSLVIGLMGAVNRDPARFEQPDRLDIGRHPNAHFTFGSGIHICIGAALARLEAQIAFDSLLDRFPVINLAGEAQWRLDRINARGLATLPVQFEEAVTA